MEKPGNECKRTPSYLCTYQHKLTTLFQDTLDSYEDNKYDLHSLQLQKMICIPGLRQTAKFVIPVVTGPQQQTTTVDFQTDIQLYF